MEKISNEKFSLGAFLSIEGVVPCVDMGAGWRLSMLPRL